MIKIENVDIVGWEPAIRGMRNPKNSWDKSDSHKVLVLNDIKYELGDNDLDRAHKLAIGGPVHAKYRRMIVVYVDITAPLYWWKEFDTYKVGTVANSCSTMHKIQAKEFEPIDFSVDHLTQESMACVNTILAFLNENRRNFLECESLLKTDESLSKSERNHLLAKKQRCWWQMIQLLPSSYNQKRTVMLNYEVLQHIYYSPRYNHKLDEWVEFCEWIATLPYSKELILVKDGNDK